MAFILNEFEVETAEIEAAHDFHRPNLQMAVLTLARLVETVNGMSDGWAYWQAPTKASTKLQKIVERYYIGRWNERPDEDVTAAELKSALTPIRAFVTRHNIDREAVFPNG